MTYTEVMGVLKKSFQHRQHITLTFQAAPKPRLNYSELLEAAVEYAIEGDNLDVFDSPVLQAVIKQKWDSSCKQMHQIMTFCYFVYIVLFSCVTAVLSRVDAYQATDPPCI